MGPEMVKPLSLQYKKYLPISLALYILWRPGFYEEIQWEIIVVTQYCCKEGKSAHQQKC